MSFCCGDSIDTELKDSLQQGVPNTNTHTALQSYIDGYHSSLFLQYRTIIEECILWEQM